MEHHKRILESKKKSAIATDLLIEGREAMTTQLHMNTIRRTVPHSNPERNYIRAFIDNIAMPKSFDELLFLANNRDSLFDIETVLTNRIESWTAPRWAKPGDVVFFMLSKTSAYTTKHLQKLWTTEEQPYAVIERNAIEPLLVKGRWLADTYAGKIVAVGRVDSMPFYDCSPDDEGLHWQNKVFADIADEFVLNTPIDISLFRSFIRISGTGAITPVAGRTFDRLRDLLEQEGNRLPPYVLNAVSVPDFCADIGSDNWMTLSNTYRRSFILEEEYRSCYLDFLLEDVSDGPVYTECRCNKGGRKHGFADYVVELDGKFLVVEAKLSVDAESNLPEQLDKYCNVLSVDLGNGTTCSGEKFYQQQSIAIDTEAAYLYDNRRKTLTKFLSLDECARLEVEGVKAAFLSALQKA